MTAVVERVEQAQVRVKRWRRRTIVSALVVAAVGVAAYWALTRGPANALTRPPIAHGGVSGAMHCNHDVPATEIADVFGGGGTVLGYRDGARCSMLFSLANTSKANVKVLAIERTRRDFITALRLTGSSRSRAPLDELDCYGCEENQEPFFPFVMAPGEEWEIGIKGVMAGCSPRKKGGGGTAVYGSVDVTVHTLGVRRVVPVKLDRPYAVEFYECRG